MTRLRKLAAAAGTVALLALGPACKHENPKKARKPAISAMKPEPEQMPQNRRGFTRPDHESEKLAELKKTVMQQITKKTAYFWSKGVDRNKNTLAKALILVSKEGVVTTISVSVDGKRFSSSSLGLEQLQGTKLGMAHGTASFIVFTKLIPAADGPGYVRKRMAPMRPH